MPITQKNIISLAFSIFLMPKVYMVLIVLVNFQKVLVKSTLAKELDKLQITFN